LHKSLFNLILGVLFLAPLAVADVILDSTVSGTPGNYSYGYEIENQTDVGILLFSLTVTGDVRAVKGPTGWLTTTDIQAPGELQVEWISTDVPYDVPARGTLAGFSFMSDSGPGSVAFSTFNENFSEFDGQTTGPVASIVPEPSGLALLSTALISILSRRSYSVRTRSTG
jgi:hypothetical protein